MRDDDCTCMSVLLSHYGLDVDLGPQWRSVVCPFHDDRQPSATANHSGFRCFACGVKGNCYNVIMKAEDVDFARATTLHKEFTGEGYTPIRSDVTRKSWGVPPFGKGDYDRNDREVSSWLRRRPPFGG